MRSEEKIKKIFIEKTIFNIELGENQKLILEVLLDIRNLLIKRLK
jgi:hypothetical protein